MKSTRRKGFTLVELLIVIVVIGILASMMMLSSTEAVTTAKASKIISNLRNLKTAALAYYVDSMDAFINRTTKPAGLSLDIAQYLTDERKLNDPGYDVIITQKGEWYVTYKIQETGSEADAIKKKLKGRAKATRLLNTPADSATTKTEYSGGDNVAMFVR